MTHMITTAYIQGVQRRLVDGGFLRYANEEAAAADAEALGGAIQEQLPPDASALVQEGAGHNETRVIAEALADMADQVGKEADMVHAKAKIINETIQKLGSEAGTPGDNNVVAGHKPGQVAAGESSAKATDHNKELASAVPNTAHREDVFHSKPGVQADKDKGHIGQEGAHPKAEGNPGQVGNVAELKTQIENDRVRPNYHGAPGHQADSDKGQVGVEKKASLSDILARL